MTTAENSAALPGTPLPAPLPAALPTARPSALPSPVRDRWQPLRLGLVELFRYDAEEFWFRDGHLLLRGNNGTGKSKVLSLTLPLLLDANLRSSRVEPDGDPGKKMAWNLLMGDAHERRTGYSWVEFGRIGSDGQPKFLTLGLGLHAVAARANQVDSWYFIAEGSGDAALRVGQGLWLLSAQRQVLAKERLREALAGNAHGQGQVFEQAQTYRHAVDERLFQLGKRRYDALLDTLIQLRQPQLSRRPDERALSAALTESLPPLPQDLLGDVADALTQLEELRVALEHMQRLHQAVQRFDARYRSYAGMASRRQARGVRHAQTAFDNASRARHDAQAALATAQAQEDAAQQRRDNAATMLAGARIRQETLQTDPLNADANRLEAAARQSRQRDQELAAAQRDADAAGAQATREASLLHAAAARAARAHDGLLQMRAQALQLAGATGLHAALAEHAFVAGHAQALADAPAAAHASGRDSLLAIAARRRDDVLLLRRRLQAWTDAQAAVAPLRHALQDRKADTEDAADAAATADAQAEQQAAAHLDAWARHLEALRELVVDADAVLDALAPWLAQLGSPADGADGADAAAGEHPGRSALRAAQTAALSTLADSRAALALQRSTLATERQALEQERAALQAGVDTGPPAPAWRPAGTRDAVPGAPLWQLVDFAPGLPMAGQAGLEAALQGADLLDAWVTPDGQLLHGADGKPWPDATWLPRPAQTAQAAQPAQDLSHWLRPDPAPASGVAPASVAALLRGVACGPQDDAGGEAWVASDGRFRLAGLGGAAPVAAAARHIGHAARQAARAQRLQQVTERLAALAADSAALDAAALLHGARADRVTHEWQQAPTEHAVLQAQQAASTAARALAQARRHEAEALRRWQAADQAAAAARQALEHDAADLRLPADAAGLQQVDADLHRCTDALHALHAALNEWRGAWPEHSRQQQRASDAQQHNIDRQAHRADRARLAEEARTHLAALELTLGPQVETLQQRIARARSLVNRLENSEKRQGEVLRSATEARAVATQRHTQAQQQFDDSSAARADAVERLRQFAATGLLASGLAGSLAAPVAPPETAREAQPQPQPQPQLETPEPPEPPAPPELPDPAVPWTIDPALTLARRIEQALSTLDDSDDAWKRGQQRVAEDLQELQRALSALGETAAATTNDFGFAVHVQWQQRAERPDTLAALLHKELQARQQLLSASERQVLENHLQAEIASQLQALMRAASQQVASINAELHRRPTTTGVRFRLQWQPLPEGLPQGQGAPAGLHAARERLLNTHAALWTAGDRRAFGALLQQRIQDERQRADGSADGNGSGSGSGNGSGEGGNLLDQLARALDYRQWHQFRVERWQDGAWRKLAGPASSGERALGLTVPLFAAVATFYGASPQAPRLMLLDEAFAGIDDAARAHCMALVREFDLDFVITSEREWGCYAELPGVAICQLQRREGIDAVHVSRWTWDGHARRPDAPRPRGTAPALGDSGGDGLVG